MNSARLIDRIVGPSLLAMAAVWAMLTAASAFAQTLPAEQTLRELKPPAMPSVEQLQRVPPPAFPTDEALRAHGWRERSGSALPHAPAPALAAPDLGAIAEQFRQLRPDRAALSQGDLLIFVSFSMPEATLRALVEQARRSGAVLVLRGLHQNSIKATLPRVRALLGTGRAGVGLQIDPRLFRAFEVKAVPTFALTEPQALAQSCSSQSCNKPGRWVSVSGNVTLHAALAAMVHAAPELAGSAAHFTQRLEARR